MITRKELARLAKLNSEEGILSAYIMLDPRLRHYRDQPITRFKSAVKSAARRITDQRWQEVLQRESERVLSYLKKEEPKGRGLVIFSCRPANVWEILSLEVVVPPFVDVDVTSKTTILTRILDEHPPFAAVVVQRDRARIYLSEQRVSREATQIASEVPGQHEQGGWSQARWQRHIEVHFAEHLKKVVDELKLLDGERSFERVAVGGVPETLDELQKILPNSLARKVVGTFPVGFKHETEEAILERARRVKEEDERREEEKLVATVVDAAKAGRKGTLGIERTLHAVQEGRVRNLVVVEGVDAEGSACLVCDYFAVRPFAQCPLCGGEGTRRDVIDYAAEKVFLSGGHVETVYGKAREPLSAEGGIGATLRF